MKTITKLAITAFLALNILTANDANQIQVIKDYGKITIPAQAAVKPDPKSSYKILYRVSNDAKKHGVNAALWHVARLYNLLNAGGVEAKNIDLVVVFSGSGLSSALNDKAYKDKFKVANPNTKLIEELAKNNITLHICAQSLADQKVLSSSINKHVKVTFSAMIDVVEYSKKGYVVF